MTRRLESLMFMPPRSGRGVIVHASGRTLNAAALDLSTDVARSDARVVAPGHVAFGETLAGRALLLSPSAASDAASAMLLDLIDAGVAPALLVLDRADVALAGATLLGRALCARGPGLVALDSLHFGLAVASHTLTLEADGRLILTGARLAGLANVTGGGALAHEPSAREAANDALSLSYWDQRCLAGHAGTGAKVAMETLMRLATLKAATRVVDVTRVHFGSTGPPSASLGSGSRMLLERLRALEAQVVVATTCQEASRNRALSRGLGIEAGRSPSLAREADGTWLRLRDGRWHCVPRAFGLCAALTGRAPVIW